MDMQNAPYGPAHLAERTGYPSDGSDSEYRSNGHAPGATDSLHRRSAASSHQGQHRHSGSREARLKRRLWIARAIALIAILASTVLAILTIHFNARKQDLEAENNALASELKRVEAEAREAKNLLAAQEVELATQMRQRIPGVVPIELGRFYDIDNRYFHKLSFSESGVGAARRLTFFAVLKNETADPVAPAAAILLFDRQGLQTGTAKIVREAAVPPAERDELAPGETRNYSAPIETSRGEAPHYFLVELK